MTAHQPFVVHADKLKACPAPLHSEVLRVKRCTASVKSDSPEWGNAHSEFNADVVAGHMEFERRKPGRRRNRRAKRGPKAMDGPGEESVPKVRGQQPKQAYVCTSCLATIMGHKAWKQHTRRCAARMAALQAVPYAVPEVCPVWSVRSNQAEEAMVFAPEVGMEVTFTLGGPARVEDAPEEAMGVMAVEDGTPVQDECSPEYGLWVRGERQWQRMEGPGAVEEPIWAGEVMEVGIGQEVVEERSESRGGTREPLQVRIERELRGGPEEEPGAGVAMEGAVQVGEPEGAEQVADEVIEWMARQLTEDEERDVEELKEGARREFGRQELPVHFHWIVAGIRKGLKKGKEEGRRKDRRRRRDIRVQTENVADSGVQSYGKRVQTDITGIDLEKMEKRAYEGIRASRKRSKAKTELESERLEVTITTERQEKEVEVVLEEVEDMPDLLAVEEGREIEEECGEVELPVLLKEVEDEPCKEEEYGLGEVGEFELGWEKALVGDLEMAGGVFGELCEAVAMVELEKWEEKGEMGDDLLTGWVLPGEGSPDGCSSPF